MFAPSPTENELNVTPFTVVEDAEPKFAAITSKPFKLTSDSLEIFCGSSQVILSLPFEVCVGVAVFVGIGDAVFVGDGDAVFVGTGEAVGISEDVGSGEAVFVGSGEDVGVGAGVDVLGVGVGNKHKT